MMSHALVLANQPEVLEIGRPSESRVIVPYPSKIAGQDP